MKSLIRASFTCLVLASGFFVLIESNDGCIDCLMAKIKPNKYAYDTIETFLSGQSSTANRELELGLLMSWYENEVSRLPAASRKEAKLKEALGTLVELDKVKPKDGCKPENLKTFKKSMRDSKFDFDERKPSRVHAIILHYARIYEKDCTTTYIERFFNAIARITDDHLKLARELGRRIAHSRPSIDKAAWNMNQKLLYKSLSPFGRHILEEFDQTRLTEACTSYRSLFDAQFWRSIVDFSRVLHKTWTDSQSLRIGWVDWEICDRYLKGHLEHLHKDKRS